MAGDAVSAVKSAVTQPARKTEEPKPEIDPNKDDGKPDGTDAGSTVIPTNKFQAKLVKCPDEFKGKAIG